MMNGLDIVWVLFNAFYFVFFFMGAGMVVLFLMRFKPTARFIKRVFNADIDWD